MTDATLDTTGSKPAVRLERHLPDPPPVVWQAITDRAQLKEWFPCDVIVEGGRWEVGAALSFPFPPEVIEMTLAGPCSRSTSPSSSPTPGVMTRSSASSCTRRARVPAWCSATSSRPAGRRGTPPAGTTAWTGWRGSRGTRTPGPAGSLSTPPRSSRSSARRRAACRVQGRALTGPGHAARDREIRAGVLRVGREDEALELEGDRAVDRRPDLLRGFDGVGCGEHACRRGQLDGRTSAPKAALACSPTFSLSRSRGIASSNMIA